MSKRGKGIFLYVALLSLFSLIVLAYTYQYNKVLSLSYDIEIKKRELASLQTTNEKLRNTLEEKIHRYSQQRESSGLNGLHYPEDDQVIWVKCRYEE